MAIPRTSASAQEETTVPDRATEMCQKSAL